MSFMEDLEERIKLKKQEISRQEDYIFQQENANDFYCLCGDWDRDHMKLANLKRELRELEQERHIGFTKQEIGDKTVYFPKSSYRQFNKSMENIKIQNKDIDNQIDSIVCPFLEYDANGKSRCTIYEMRPEICRLFGKGGHPFLTCPNNRFVEANL